MSNSVAALHMTQNFCPKSEHLLMHHHFGCNKHMQHINWKLLMSLIIQCHIFIQWPNVDGSMGRLMNSLDLSQISPKMHQNELMQHEFLIQWIKLGTRWKPLSSLFYWCPFWWLWPQFGQDSGGKCEILVILGVVHQKSRFCPLDQPSCTFSTNFCCCRVHLC